MGRNPIPKACSWKLTRQFNRDEINVIVLPKTLTYVETFQSDRAARASAWHPVHFSSLSTPTYCPTLPTTAWVRGRPISARSYRSFHDIHCDMTSCSVICSQPLLKNRCKKLVGCPKDRALLHWCRCCALPIMTAPRNRTIKINAQAQILFDYWSWLLIQR